MPRHLAGRLSGKPTGLWCIYSLLLPLVSVPDLLGVAVSTGDGSGVAVSTLGGVVGLVAVSGGAAGVGAGLVFSLSMTILLPSATASAP